MHRLTVHIRNPFPLLLSNLLLLTGNPIYVSFNKLCIKITRSFLNISAIQFDEAVDKLYKELPTMKEHEVLAGFARVVASFKYGHTDIGWRESPVKYHVVPVNFYWFSDGIYTEGADDDEKFSRHWQAYFFGMSKPG